MNIHLPASVLTVFEVLELYNKQVFLVGGCVRDIYLNRIPKDYDFASNAKPEKLIEIFKEKGYKTLPTGIDFGTITVIIEGDSFEITTFRSDGDYSDGRRPSAVEFSRSIDEDLKRRDFTMNALAFNPSTGVIDNHNGIEDLYNRVIKAVGNAEERLSEDFLRAFRAVRFANQLDMKLELPIVRVIENNYKLTKNVSKERINEELTKILTSGKSLKYSRLLALLLKDVLPEFKESFETLQNHPYHCYNVGEHTVKTIDNIDSTIELKLTALLHDLGKTATRKTDEDGTDRFIGHNAVSRDIANRFLKDLKFSNDIINRVKTLVYNHDRQIEPTKRSVKRVLNKFGEDVFLDLLKIKTADIKSQNLKYIERLEDIEALKEIYQDILEEQQCFSLKDLAVNGRDLIEVGIPKGKQIGVTLNLLLELVIDQPQLNDKEKLLLEAKQSINKVDNKQQM